MSFNISIINTKVANIASVIAMFSRLGLAAELTDEAKVVTNADYLVLPGVGTFAAGMKALNRNGIALAVKQRISSSRPTLAICLGFQMLFGSSEESPGEIGLKIYSNTIKRYTESVKVPHIGWNKVIADKQSKYLVDGYAYFANSFCCRFVPDGLTGAVSYYDSQFVAAIEDKNLLACQFHPELSGEYGMDIVQRWLRVNRC